MADECLPQIQACRIRVADLDPNGVPTPGAGHLYVSDAMSSFEATPVYRDGDEIVEPNACGEVKLDYTGPPSLRRADATLIIVTHDPHLIAKLGGGDVLTDGDAVGAAGPPVGVVDETRTVSIELWAKRINDGVLDPDFPYAWWAFPLANNLREGVHTFNNGSKMPSFTMQLHENPNWFDGPLNDWPATSDRIWQWIPTTDLPEAFCGDLAIAAS